MDFIDNLIQTLFDIIDNLFWFSPYRAKKNKEAKCIYC